MDPISAVSAAFSLGEKWLTGESQDERLEKELQSQKVAEVARTRRALIRRSTSRLRVFCLSILSAPLVWGAVEVMWTGSANGLGTYFAEIDKHMPGWWSAALQSAFAAIWAGAEVRNLNANRDERKLAEKEADAEKESAKSRHTEPEPGSRP